MGKYKLHIITIIILLIPIVNIDCSKKDGEQNQLTPEEKLKVYKDYLKDEVDNCKQNYKPEEYENTRVYKSWIRQQEILSNQSDLNKPYLIRVGVGLNTSSLVYLYMIINWLEEGSNIKGLHISISKAENGEAVKIVKLPLFKDGTWNENRKEEYKNQIDKSCVLEVLIGDSYNLKSPSKPNLPFDIIAPASIINDKVNVALYDDMNNVTNTVELFITEEAQDYILSKREEVKNSGDKLNIKTPIANRLNAIREQGHPTTLEEVNATYEIPEPGQNAADIYMKAFNHLVRWEWKPIPQSEVERMSFWGDDSTSLDPNQNASHPKESNSNNYYGAEILSNEEDIEIPEDWDQKNSALLPIIGDVDLPPRGQRMHKNTMEIVEDFLKDHNQSLQYLYQACALEDSRYPLHTRNDYLSSPFLGEIRQCIIILRIEAYYYCQKQNLEKSLQSIITMIALNRSLKNVPSILSQMIKLICENQVIMTLEHIINEYALTDQQIGRIQLSLDKCHQENNFTNAFICTRAISHDHLTEIHKFQEFGKNGAIKQIHSGAGNYESLQISYLDMMERYINISKYPFPSRYLTIKDVKLKTMVFEEDFDLLEGVKSNNKKALLIETKNVAYYRLAQTALAIERYRFTQKQLPNSLSDLIPDYLERILKDPYDGQNIRYLKIKNGYKLYSVGNDLIDNKGKGGYIGAVMIEPGYDFVFTVQRYQKP